MVSTRCKFFTTIAIIIFLAASCAPLNRFKPAAQKKSVSEAAQPAQSVQTVQPEQVASAVTQAPSTQATTAAAADKPAKPGKTRQPGQQKQKQQPQGQGQGQGQQSPGFFPTSSFVTTASSFNAVLGSPTENSVVFSLYSLENASVTISYQPAAGGSEQVASASLAARVPQKVELSGLQPDTEYNYKVALGGQAVTEYAFHTQRSVGSTFTFTIDADPHNRDPNFNGELYSTTLTNVHNEKPDFHFDLGDTFMTEKVQAETRAEAESTFTDMRPYFGLMGAPLFLVNGNHEGEVGWLLGSKGSELPLWSTQLRQAYYANPVPGGFYSGASSTDPATGSKRDGYYAFTWGDALFIALDPFWYTSAKPSPNDDETSWNWTLGKEQYDWLKTTLETSQAKYKFVFIHNLAGGSDKDARGGIEAAPYFEWGGNNKDGSYGFDTHRPGWGKPIHQLLVENGVSAVFHGHDHVFVKQDLDGIVYLELPQPSMAMYNNTRMAADYGYLSGDVLGSSGHIRVTVSPSGALVEYVRAYLKKDEKSGQVNGQVDYSFQISPK